MSSNSSRSPFLLQISLLTPNIKPLTSKPQPLPPNAPPLAVTVWQQESKTVAELSSRERAAFFISFLQTISLLPSSLESIKLLATAAPSLASSLRLSELDVTQQWLLFAKCAQQHFDHFPPRNKQYQVRSRDMRDALQCS